jgi:hypothetical protein
MGTTRITVAKLAGPIVGRLRETLRGWADLLDARRAGEDRLFEEIRDRLIAQGERRKAGRKVSDSDAYGRGVRELRARFDDTGFAAYALALRAAVAAHAHEPPVVFYRSYVDPWTTAAAESLTDLLADPAGEPSGELIAPFRSATRSRSGWSEPISLALFLPTDRQRLKEDLSERLAALVPGNPERGVDWFERRQFYQAVAEGVVSWEELLEDRGVDTALLLTFQTAGGCWLDGEVTAAECEIPSWFADLAAEAQRALAGSPVPDPARGAVGVGIAVRREKARIFSGCDSAIP